MMRNEALLFIPLLLLSAFGAASTTSNTKTDMRIDGPSNSIADGSSQTTEMGPLQERILLPIPRHPLAPSLSKAKIGHHLHLLPHGHAGGSTDGTNATDVDGSNEESNEREENAESETTYESVDSEEEEDTSSADGRAYEDEDTGTEAWEQEEDVDDGDTTDKDSDRKNNYADVDTDSDGTYRRKSSGEKLGGTAWPFVLIAGAVSLLIAALAVRRRPGSRVSRLWSKVTRRGAKGDAAEALDPSSPATSDVLKVSSISPSLAMPSDATVSV